jgi:hypothetical protein
VLPPAGSEPDSLALVDLGLPHPASEGFTAHSELVGDGADGLPLGFVLVLVLEHHVDGPLPHFTRIPLSFAVHDSILSKVGASKKVGTVQPPTRDHLDH